MCVCVCVCAVIKFFERTIPECQAGEHAIKRETFRFGAQRTLVIKRIRAVIGGPALFLALLARPWAGLFRLSFSFFLIMSPRRRQIGTLCAVFSDGSRRPREAHANFCQLSAGASARFSRSRASLSERRSYRAADEGGGREIRPD